MDKGKNLALYPFFQQLQAVIMLYNILAAANYIRSKGALAVPGAAAAQLPAI